MLRQEIATFAELARHMGVTRQAISEWFAGGSFSSSSLAALCKILKCTPNDILILEDDPNVTAPVAQMVMAG